MVSITIHNITMKYGMGVTDKMSKYIHKTMVALGVTAGLMAGGMTSSVAATVPAGVELAQKQTLVRNNGSEPQSLDPHKIEGVPESALARDLLKVSRSLDQMVKFCLARQSAGKIKILKNGLLKFVRELNGQMEIP